METTRERLPELLEFYEYQPKVDVLESEYTRLLGYPIGRVLEGRAGELADEARNWYSENGSPWIYARSLSDFELEEGRVVLQGQTFHSPHLFKTLKEGEAESIILVAVGAGEEIVERAGALWTEGKPDEYFFAETYGSAVVEQLVVLAGSMLCNWAEDIGLMVLPHYSPGYDDWDISEQNALLGLIKVGACDGFEAELSVLDSGMLTPKKSMLAVFGITAKVSEALKINRLVPCQNCSLPACNYRRKPYFLDTMKDLETGTMSANPSENKIGILNLEAKYSISPRALRKWVESRLELLPVEGGGYDAVFTYDGTTCSNMGHPLRYLYRISVGRRETGYLVLDASCGPDGTQEGHLRQCEYLKYGDTFLKEIEEERPLVGEPLDAVLNWRHPSSPAGCFCEASSRNHKWTIAYEVLHYALAQMEKAS